MMQICGKWLKYVICRFGKWPKYLGNGLNTWDTDLVFEKRFTMLEMP